MKIRFYIHTQFYTQKSLQYKYKENRGKSSYILTLVKVVAFICNIVLIRLEFKIRKICQNKLWSYRNWKLKIFEQKKGPYGLISSITSIQKGYKFITVPYEFRIYEKLKHKIKIINIYNQNKSE